MVVAALPPRIRQSGETQDEEHDIHVVAEPVVAEVQSADRRLHLLKTMHTSSVYTDAELQQNLTEMQHLYDRGEFGAWRQEVAARLDDLIDPTKIEQERTLTLRETYQDENGVSIKTTGSGIAVEGDSGEIRLDNVHEVPLEKRGWKFWKRKFWQRRPKVPKVDMSTREQLMDYVSTTVQRRPPSNITEVEMEEWKDTFVIGGVDDLEEDLGIELPVDKPDPSFDIGGVAPEDVGIERPVAPFNYFAEEDTEVKDTVKVGETDDDIFGELDEAIAEQERARLADEHDSKLPELPDQEPPVQEPPAARH